MLKETWMKVISNILRLAGWTMLAALITYPAMAHRDNSISSWRQRTNAHLDEAKPATVVISNSGSIWNIERVDEARFVHPNFGDHATQVDALGRLHVAYGGDHLYYSLCTGDSAQSCMVETVDDRDYTGQFASLALDNQSYPQIAYFAASTSGDCDDDTLRFARWTGNHWQIQEVDRGCRGEQISLALDAGGNAHISYLDNLEDKVRYAYLDGQGWHSTEVGSGYASSLAIDGEGILHLAYTGPSSQAGLWYRRKTAAGWEEPIQLESEGVYQHPSLAVDSAGGVHISYSDVNNGKLRYANNVEGCWWMQDIADMDYQGFTALTTNKQGDPMIVYQHNGVRYVYKRGWVWSAPELASTGGGGYLSLALDTFNQQPVLTYYQASGLYFTRKGVGWQAGEQIDQTAQTGLLVSTVADNMGDVHVVYYDESSGLLRYAKSSGDTWILETILEGVQVAWTDIALDSKRQPQVVFEEYLNAESQQVRYFVRQAAGWQEGPLVSLATNRAARPSLEVGTGDKPHVAFIDRSAYTTQKLVFAQWNGSGWDRQDVDQGDVVVSHSLALRPTGDPVVAYAIRQDGMVDLTDSLRYASRTAEGAWIVDEIGSDKQVDSIELGLTSAGDPHLAYLVATSSNDTAVRHSYWDGDAWQTEGILGWSASGHLSLAIGASGWPQIGFMYEQSLFHAQKGPAGWVVTEWLDSTPARNYDSFSGFDAAVGDYQDLVLDASGQPLFVYHGEMDLKSASRQIQHQVFLPMMRTH
jgi:hypothetical protein